jgi:hypothetical protein
LTLACACSSSNDGTEPPAHPAGWLSVTLSEPTGERACFGAAPTPYNYGSEEKPLVEDTSCTIHVDENHAWASGHLVDSMTAAGGGNLNFWISTEQDLVIVFVSDFTGGVLELDPNAGATCAPTFSAIIGDAASVEFDCPLLTVPNDPLSGCGARGTATFENCDTE